jgi:hypothetical protein
MLRFDSWEDLHSQKLSDICCVVVFWKQVYPYPGNEKPHYSADIQDHRGIIPETEINCSWYGSSYESMTAAIEEALGGFAKTHAFVNKVHTIIKDNQ